MLRMITFALIVAMTGCNEARWPMNQDERIEALEGAIRRAEIRLSDLEMRSPDPGTFYFEVVDDNEYRRLAADYSVLETATMVARITKMGQPVFSTRVVMTVYDATARLQIKVTFNIYTEEEGTYELGRHVSARAVVLDYSGVSDPVTCFVDSEYGHMVSGTIELTELEDRVQGVFSVAFGVDQCSLELVNGRFDGAPLGGLNRSDYQS